MTESSLPDLSPTLPDSATGTVLVTGATGLVGRALCQHLSAAGRPVRALVRTAPVDLPAACTVLSGYDLAGTHDWGAALAGCQVVVHCAARVHQMQDAAGPAAERTRALYQASNVDATLRLARQAVAAGVRRFVFLSSLKVNGEMTHPGRPFTTADRPAPQDAYGQSKHAAETALFALGRDTGLEIVVVRPPLVYGPGVKANFAALLRAVDAGWPLPLGAIDNRRSLVYLGNLIDLLDVCLDHPAAANAVWLVSDGTDLSTTALLRAAATALDRPARLLPVPPVVLRGAARLLGRAGVAERLLDSLQADISATRAALGWQPPWSVAEGLAVTAAAWRAAQAA